MKLRIFINHELSPLMHADIEKSINLDKKGHDLFQPFPKEETIISLKEDDVISRLNEIFCTNKALALSGIYAIYDNDKIIKGDYSYSAPQHRIDRTVSELVVDFESLDDLNDKGNLPLNKIKDIKFIATHQGRIQIRPINITVKDNLLSKESPIIKRSRAEIKKNISFLMQASRTNTGPAFFKNIPPELQVVIASHTGDVNVHSESQSEKIAAKHMKIVDYFHDEAVAATEAKDAADTADATAAATAPTAP